MIKCLQNEPHYSVLPYASRRSIKDEVEVDWKISQRALARQMGISYSQLNEVLNGKRPVNTELALLFEAALGLDPEMLLNMQTRYNMQVARADQRTQDRWNEVRKLCASFL
ncbi:MAG: HigA family addiction module antitoxin [Bacteroides cellulosilyticus]